MVHPNESECTLCVPYASIGYIQAQSTPVTPKTTNIVSISIICSTHTKMDEYWFWFVQRDEIVKRSWWDNNERAESSVEKFAVWMLSRFFRSQSKNHVAMERWMIGTMPMHGEMADNGFFNVCLDRLWLKKVRVYISHGANEKRNGKYTQTQTDWHYVVRAKMKKKHKQAFN